MIMGNQQGNIYTVSSSGTYPNHQGGLRVTDGEAVPKSKNIREPRRHTVDGVQIDQELLRKTDEDLMRQREAYLGQFAKRYPEQSQRMSRQQYQQKVALLPQQQYPATSHYGTLPRSPSAGVNDNRYSTLPTRPGSADVHRRALSPPVYQARSRPTGPVYESDVDDPGMLSEAETSSTGFSRGHKYRASLPIKSPSKNTTSNFGGLVFLVYQGQTRRALLPNEVTHIDTLKALFVRSFSDKLTMQSLNSPWRKIYVLNSKTNRYQQLQDIRQIHDRCMLKLYEEDSGEQLQSSYPSSNVLSIHETNVDDIDNYYSESEIDGPGRGSNLGRSPSNHGAQDLQRQGRPPPSPQRHQSGYQSDSGLSPQGYQPTYDPDGIRSGASTPDPETRNRMARMEAQLANLTAWVQTSGKTESSHGGSDRGSNGSYTPRSSLNVADHRRYSGISDGSDSTPQPTLSLEIQEKIKDVESKTKDLKNEYKNLRRIHQAQAETMRETIQETFHKIMNVFKTVPGANDHPVRSMRDNVNVNLDSYQQDAQRIRQELNDLEAAVEEVRGDVISRRCHVNMSDVESMALALSKITKSLAEQKGHFPKVAQDMKSVMAGEVEIVVREERFIKEEPDRIEETLRKCKKLTGTLFTLKKLSSVQEHRPHSVPDLQTNTHVGEEEKKSVLDSIQALLPNHDSRVQKLQEAEIARERKKKLIINSETMKFEKSLEMASKSLKQAETIPKPDISKEPMITKNEHGIQTFRGQIVNKDIGMQQERKDDIKFIDESEQSIEVQTTVTKRPSAFTKFTPNANIPSNSQPSKSSTSPHYQYVQKPLETISERHVTKSQIVHSEAVSSAQGSNQMQVNGHLAPPTRSSSRSPTNSVDMVPTRDDAPVREKKWGSRGRSIIYSVGQARSSSVPVTMATSYTTTVITQKPRPRQVMRFEQNIVQGISSSVDNETNNEIHSVQDLPEHLSSDDSDTDSVNSQDSQKDVGKNVSGVTRSKTTDEISHKANGPPPTLPRSSSLSRAQIIQKTNEMRNEKSMRLREEYLKLQAIQREYRQKRENSKSPAVPPKPVTKQKLEQSKSPEKAVTNGRYREPLVTTI